MLAHDNKARAARDRARSSRVGSADGQNVWPDATPRAQAAESAAPALDRVSYGTKHPSWMLAIRTMPTRVGTLTFSRRPNDAIFAAVALEPVDVWWNLAAELRDLELGMQRCAATVLSARITDYAVPSDVPAFASQLDEVVALLFCQGRVHVSCYGGRGRTGLALACIAMLIDEISPEAALVAAHGASGGPETEEQRAFVRQLHADLRG